MNATKHFAQFACLSYIDTLMATYNELPDADEANYSDMKYKMYCRALAPWYALATKVQDLSKYKNLLTCMQNAFINMRRNG